PMTRRPPRPTLLPYTTLFRSRPTRQRLSPQRRSNLGEAFRQPTALSDNLSGLRRQGFRSQTRILCEHHPRLELAQQLGSAVRRADRKSTRLNSSHVSISYAVF